MTAVTCARPDLKWALAAVLPHVMRDDTLPALCAVRLELEPGTLYAVATDRYTLGCARVPLDYDGAPAAALLAADDVRELVKRLARKDDSPAALEFYSDGDISVDWRIRYPSLCYPGPWRAGQMQEFPDWRKLLGRILRREPELPGPGDGFNPEYLGRFTAARRPGCTSRALAITPVARRSAVVIGDRFAGAISGVLLMDDHPDHGPREVLADWRERLPEVAK